MKRFSVTLFIALSTSGVAWADACSDLINQAQAGLSMSSIDEQSRSQFQQWLDTGKSGDVSRCEAAITASVPNSSPQRGPGGHICNKSPDTV